MDALSIDELLRVLGGARARSERDFLAILVGFHHGLRPSEVVQITPDHFADGYLGIQRLKGSDYTYQALVSHDNPLLDERTALVAYSNGKAANQRLFKFAGKHFWTLFKKYTTQAGIPKHKRHPHALKHTCGTFMYNNTKDLPATQRRLGHKSGGNTMIYTRASEEKSAELFEQALKGFAGLNSLKI